MSANELRPGSGSRIVVRFVGGVPDGKANVRAGRRQFAGKVLIAAGFVASLLGIVAYCAVCLAGGVDVDLGEILLRNAVPLAGLTLGIIGAGTVAWLAGSLLYLAGLLEADELDAIEFDPARSQEAEV